MISFSRLTLRYSGLEHVLHLQHQQSSQPESHPRLALVSAQVFHLDPQPLVSSTTREYDRKKPPFLLTKNDRKKEQKMNIHYAFSIREVSEVVDKDQTLQVRKLHFYCRPNVYSLLDSNVLHCLLDRGSARSRPGLSPDFITISRHLPFS